ncbi:hypothetical protein FI667_g12627, partial [Globisporangium splendens]
MALVSDTAAYETALQSEGGGSLAPAATISEDARETLQIAFHEQFAIARSVNEKRDVVRASLLPGTADALYYSALCDLHELQLLLLQGTQGDGDTEEEQKEDDGGESAVAKATQFLEQNKAQLMNVIQLLSMKQCYKKATRVQQRLMLLELELRSRAQASLEASGNKDSKIARTSETIDNAMGIDYVATESNVLRVDSSSLRDVDAIAVDIVNRTWMPLSEDDGVVKDYALVNEQIALTTKDLGAALGIAFTDIAPANVAASVDVNTLPTHLDNLLFDINAIVIDIINRTWGPLDDMSLRGTARVDLCALDAHARELVFTHLLYNAGGTAVTDVQRWALLEMFLDEFVFEYVDVKGYLAVIVEDIKRESIKSTNRGFGFRQVHNKLSVSHLNEMLEMEPALFRDNIQFAVHGVQLLQAAAEDGKKELLDRRDATQSTYELEHLSACLAFTNVFSGRLNGLRLVLLYQKLLLLQRRHWRDPTDSNLLQTLLEYIQFPRFHAESMFNPISVDVPGEDFVKFDGSADATCATLAAQLGFKSVYKDTDRLMIEEALSTLWSAGVSEDIEALLDNELDKAFLRSVKARCMIKTGQGNALEWSKHLSQQENDYLAELSSSSELAFCDSSPAYFSPEDELSIHVRARNIKHVTVHLYEVRSTEYYSRFRREIPGSINVDGLLPNDEQHIDLSHLSAFQESRIAISFPQTKHKRGVFVVEVLENGQTCRAILRKGFLRHVDRVTMNGQELSVLDENGEVVRDAKVVVLNSSRKAQPGRTYTADATGKILVPFRNLQQSAVADTFAIVYCHDDFGSFSPSFNYLTGDLELIADMHIDCQQLVSGATAHLITQPRVYIGATQLPLDELTNVNVIIHFAKVRGTDAGHTKEEFRFADMNEFQQSNLSFEIPLDTDFFTVSLSASKGRDESSLDSDSNKLAARSLSTSKLFSVQHVTKYPLHYSPHLVRRPIPGASLAPSAQEFNLLLLGHNGEAIQNTEVQLSCKHIHSTKNIVVRLQSDSNGEIKLGALDGVRQVSVESRWSWDLPNARQTDVKAQHVNCATGDTIEIPIPRNCQSQLLAWYEKNLVSLYRVIKFRFSDRVLESAAANSTIEIIKNESGTPVLMSVTIHSAGLFALCIRPVNVEFPISVVGKKTRLHSSSSDVLIQQKQSVLASPSRPLVIFSQSIKCDSKQDISVLEIQLRNFSPRSTQLIVTLKQFLDPQKKSICQVLAKSLQSDPAFETSLLESKYLKKRKMSDEYQYILKRRLLSQSKPNSPIFLGESSLPKPSLLQTPFEIDRTDMEDVVMVAGDKVLDTALNQGAMLSQLQQQQSQRRHLRSGYSGDIPTDGIPSTTFLASRAQVVSTWGVGTDGIVRIDLSSLEFFSTSLDRGDTPGAFEVIVVAIDHAKGQICSSESLMTLSTGSQEELVTEIAKRDIRLVKDQALQPQSGHYLLKQLHDTVRAGTKRILARSSSTKYAIYTSIEDVLKLWKSLCRENEVHRLVEYLQEWNRMDRDAKVRLYFANASDDLNVFLLHKDPAFFQLYVRPLVASKISKSLIDYYLLDDKIALHNLYSAPGAFQALSVIEKLLIAERMPSTSDVERICQRVHLDVASVSSGKMKSLFASVIAQRAIAPNALGTAPRSENAPQLHQNPQLGDGTFINDMASTFGIAASYSPTSPAYSPIRPPYALMNQMCALAHPGGMSLSSRSMVRRRHVHRGQPNFEFDHQDDFADSDDNFGVESVPSEDDESEGECNEIQSEKPKAAKAETAYIPPGKVRRLQDKRFFHTQRAQLDGKNSFWKAYAEYLLRVKSSPGASESRFVSSFLPEALLSLSEGLLALAVVDLPMQTTGSTHITSLPCGSQVELMPKNDVLLYHQSIEIGECEDDPNSKLIVRQRIIHFKSTQPSVLEVVVGTKYTYEVTVSNTTDSELSGINLLMQIPQGAIPLNESSYYTRNHVFNAPANTTMKYEVHFYFPETGEYDQYPAHAAIDGKVVAWAKTDTTVTVLRKVTLVDLASWSDVAARGSIDEVVQCLSSQKDILSVDLGLAFWRCKDIAFYCGLTSFLRGKMIYNEGIWKYAFVHNDLDAIKEYLRSATSLTKTAGLGLSTAFFSTTELFSYLSTDGFDHTEFGPFLHRRVHEAKGSVPAMNSASGISTNGGRILNKNARAFYHALCCRLEMFATLDGQQLLVLAYFMLLFNRMEDAMHLFSRLQALPPSKKTTVENTVQFDYVDSYLDLFRDQDECNFAVTRRNVAKYKKHPHARWRERFVRLGEFIAEYDAFEDHKVNQAVYESLQISGSASASEKEIADLPPAPPESRTLQVKLDAVVSDGKIHVSSQHLGECEISFYPIDVEFMFSTKPFGTFSNSSTSTSSVLLVQPRHRMSVKLVLTPSGNSPAQTEVSIPQELQGQQMMVRVREATESREIESAAAPIDVVRPYFNSSLQVDVMKQSGMLQVFHKGMPVSRCYVKVYAKVSSSSSAAAQFYKDGYTDLLGKFDYVGINGELVARVERFLILTSHPKFGASVHQIDPPVLATTAPDFQHQGDSSQMLSHLMN